MLPVFVQDLNSAEAAVVESGLVQLVLLSMANASISFTVAETKLFKPLREWVGGLSTFLGELFSCGYCFGHWTAFAMVAIYRPRLFEIWLPLDYFLTVLVLAWLSAFQWVLLCWLIQTTGK